MPPPDYAVKKTLINNYKPLVAIIRLYHLPAIAEFGIFVCTILLE